MDWITLLKSKVQTTGAKAILFASERSSVVKPLDYESPEYQCMKSASREVLETIILNQFKASKSALQYFLQRNGSTSKENGSRKRSKHQ